MSRVCVLIRRGEEAMWCGHVDNSLQEHESGDWTLDSGRPLGGSQSGQGLV